MERGLGYPPPKRVRLEEGEKKKGARIASLRDLARSELMRVDAGDNIELVTRRCNEQRLIVWGYPNGKDSNWLRFAKWNSRCTTITVNDPWGGDGNVVFFGRAVHAFSYACLVHA